MLVGGANSALTPGAINRQSHLCAKSQLVSDDALRVHVSCQYGGVLEAFSLEPFMLSPGKLFLSNRQCKRSGVNYLTSFAAGRHGFSGELAG